MADGFFHHGQQLSADFFGDDLAADIGLRLGDHVARLIGDFVHHIGCHQIPAVGDRRNGCGHLHRGDGLVLAKGRRVQVGVDIGHLLGIVDAGPAGFVGQVNAGGFGKAERLDIIVKSRGLQGLCGLDKPDVAAVVQRLRHILQTVGVAQGAVVGVLIFFRVLVDGQLAAAVKLLPGGHHTGIQPGGCRDQLKDRTGDIQLGNVLILPLGLAQHTLQTGVLAADGVAFLVQRGLAADAAVLHNVGHLLFTQAALQPLNVVGGQRFGVEDRLHFCVGNHIRLVGVKLLGGGHGQHRAGLDVHHNGAAAAVHLVGVHGLVQILFHDGLHVFVNRQHKVVAVHGVIDLGGGFVQHLAVAVGFGNAASGCAGQRFLVGLFQPVGTLAVGIAEPQHRCQKFAVGVAAHTGLLGAQVKDARPCGVFVFGGDTVFVGIGKNGIGHGFFHALGNHAVLVRLARVVFGGQHTVHSLGGSAVVQKVGDLLGGGLQLGVGCPRLDGGRRVADDVPHGVGFGQHLSVGA